MPIAGRVTDLNVISCIWLCLETKSSWLEDLYKLVNCMYSLVQ